MIDLSDQNVVAALLDAQQHRTPVKIYVNTCEHPITSSVLGFNYYENTLLLDGFKPPVKHAVVSSMEAMPFWIQLKHQDRYLNLYCLVEEYQYDLYTLKLLKHEFTDNQRWNSRIHFDARKGPQFTLDVPHELPIKGFIRNLSAHGALVEFYGEDIRERTLVNISQSCQIRFNDLFSIDLKCEIKHLTFERKPSCHSRLRVMFNHSSAVTFNQLDNFIEAFNDGFKFPMPSNKLLFGEANFA